MTLLLPLLFACVASEPPLAEGPDSGNSSVGDGGSTATDNNLELGARVLDPPEARLVSGLETVIEVRWTQPVPATAQVDFRVVGSRSWRNSPVRNVAVGEASAFIVGVPFDADVEYRLRVEDAEDQWVSEVQQIRTGAWPATLPHPILLANQPDLTEPTARWFLTSMNQDGEDREGRWWVFVMDRQGTVVWAQLSEEYQVNRHVSVAYDGAAMLVDHNSYWTLWDQGASSTVVRQTLDGTQHHTYATPGMHHPFVPLPDGSIAWTAKATGGNETLERVDLDGEQNQIWDCATLHEAADDGGQCGSNALFWHEATDHFLISFWSTDTVAEVDHQTGALLRWFGDLDGSWAFDPVQSQFWWQHGALFTDAGTLLVSTKNEEIGNETLVREYELDEETETLREIWSFGQGRGIYGEYMGEAHRLPGGNTLHVYGAGGHLAEATPDGTVAWEVTWEGNKHIGRTTPIEDLYDLVR